MKQYFMSKLPRITEHNLAILSTSQKDLELISNPQSRAKTKWGMFIYIALIFIKFAFDTIRNSNKQPTVSSLMCCNVNDDETDYQVCAFTWKYKNCIVFSWNKKIFIVQGYMVIIVFKRS